MNLRKRAICLVHLCSAICPESRLQESQRYEDSIALQAAVVLGHLSSNGPTRGQFDKQDYGPVKLRMVRTTATAAAHICADCAHVMPVPKLLYSLLTNSA